MSPDYEYPDHSDDGSSSPNTGSTVEINEETGVDEAPKNNDGHSHTSTDESGEETDNSTDDKNERGPAKMESEKQKIATEKQKLQFKLVTVNVDQRLLQNLKFLAKFMKFARGVEKNDIDQFINKLDGSVVDMDYEINIMSQRIQKKLTGLTANIKGVVMEETNKLVQDGLDELGIPNPELDTAVRKQLKMLVILCHVYSNKY